MTLTYLVVLFECLLLSMMWFIYAAWFQTNKERKIDKQTDDLPTVLKKKINESFPTSSKTHRPAKNYRNLTENFWIYHAKRSKSGTNSDHWSTDYTVRMKNPITLASLSKHDELPWCEVWRHLRCRQSVAWLEHLVLTVDYWPDVQPPPSRFHRTTRYLSAPLHPIRKKFTR